MLLESFFLVLRAFLKYFSAIMIEDDYSEIFWTLLFEDENVPNLELVSNAKCCPALAQDGPAFEFLQIDVLGASSIHPDDDLCWDGFQVWCKAFRHR